jgi:hypothetical protein
VVRRRRRRSVGGKQGCPSVCNGELVKYFVYMEGGEGWWRGMQGCRDAGMQERSKVGEAGRRIRVVTEVKEEEGIRPQRSVPPDSADVDAYKH